MNRQEIIKKLVAFKALMKIWETRFSGSVDIPNVRTEINKSKSFVQKVVSRAGTLKVFDIGPPPAIGGFMMRNVNPFDIIFDPPYGVDIIAQILDSVDEAIGIIESDENFSIDNIKRSESISINKKTKNTKKVFLVHGHDNEFKETVARFLEKLDLHPVILHEQANNGMTIIEKFEKHSDVGYAIVLMSPDDFGSSKDSPETRNFRARQNVIFELGYFFGKLERKNVLALIRGDIERPSDYDGVIYLDFDSNGGWKMLLAKELKEAGLEFDGNKIF